MDKLIELLNEYNKNKEGVKLGFITKITYENGIESGPNWEEELKKYKLNIISKEYEFIKWLYENNKIDRTDVPTGFEYEYQGRKDLYCVTYEVNILTMRLSIQDEPIQFLCSILK